MKKLNCCMLLLSLFSVVHSMDTTTTRETEEAYQTIRAEVKDFKKMSSKPEILNGLVQIARGKMTIADLSLHEKQFLNWENIITTEIPNKPTKLEYLKAFLQPYCFTRPHNLKRILTTKAYIEWILHPSDYEAFPTKEKERQLIELSATSEITTYESLKAMCTAHKNYKLLDNLIIEGAVNDPTILAQKMWFSLSPLQTYHLITWQKKSTTCWYSIPFCNYDPEWTDPESIKRILSNSKKLEELQHLSDRNKSKTY